VTSVANTTINQNSCGKEIKLAVQLILELTKKRVSILSKPGPEPWVWAYTYGGPGPWPSLAHLLGWAGLGFFQAGLGFFQAGLGFFQAGLGGPVGLSPGPAHHYSPFL
jgi:hypothetical protein